MKYLIPCVLLFPLLSSCTVIQEDFYQPEYLGPAPRVEVTPSILKGIIIVITIRDIMVIIDTTVRQGAGSL